MEKLRFLHCADLHLGCPHSSLPAHIADELTNDAFFTLEKMLAFVRSGSADALFIAGDLFDIPTPPNSVFERTAELIGEADVPVFITPGNHDCLDIRSPYRTREWPDCVTLFLSDEIERVSFKSFNVYGCAFNEPYCHTSKLENFRADKNNPSVMLMHGDIANESSYNPIRTQDISSSGLKYLALGHVHKRTSPHKLGSTVYAYPGCGASTGFGDEGNLGAYLVTVDDDVTADFISFGARRFVTMDTPASTDFKAELKNHSRDLVSIKINGVTDFAPDTNSLYRELSKAVFYLEITDKTTRPKSMHKNSLAGIVETIAREEEINDDAALRLALAALSGEERPIW